MRKPFLGSLLPVFLLALAGCIGNQGGSDTETFTLSGRVTRQGLPQAQGLVKLIPSDYDPSLPQPDFIRSAYTDSSGRFHFGELDKRIPYNLIAEGAPGTRRFAYAESLLAGGAETALLLEPARVFRISLHDSSYNVLDSGVAYFPGTDLLVRCGQGLAPTVVDSVPAGLRRLVVRSRAGWKHEGRVDVPAESVRVEADARGVRILPY